MSLVLQECHSERSEESAFPLAESEKREQKADFSTPLTLRSK
jgi:hypothetical protein